MLKNRINSSDEIGSLNSSSNQNEENEDDMDEMLNDEEEEDDEEDDNDDEDEDENFAEDDDEEYFSNELSCLAAADDLLDTKYTLSPKEEFGEVKQISSFFLSLTLLYNLY